MTSLTRCYGYYDVTNPVAMTPMTSLTRCYGYYDVTSFAATCETVIKFVLELVAQDTGRALFYIVLEPSFIS